MSSFYGKNSEDLFAVEIATIQSAFKEYLRRKRTLVECKNFLEVVLCPRFKSRLIEEAETVEQLVDYVLGEDFARDYYAFLVKHKRVKNLSGQADSQALAGGR
jgi:hypothetical protein